VPKSGKRSIQRVCKSGMTGGILRWESVLCQLSDRSILSLWKEKIAWALLGMDGRLQKHYWQWGVELAEEIKKIDYDIVIVGAGIIGLAMAIVAARMGFSIGVVDRNVSSEWQ
jgi:NADPH-dependent 2,4-dienoyl-CoA reductase/sulfur reductase-like enzyme